jgi:hypothetical protein
MITFYPRVGRLAGVRVLSPVTEEEFNRFVPEVGRWVRSIPSRVVFCSDLRGARVLTEAISTRIIDSMRQDNPKLKCAALVLPSSSAVLALQFERIIREAGNPARRTFRRAADAQAWLAEALRPAEQVSLAEFLAEGDEAEIDAVSGRPPVPSSEAAHRDRSSRAGPPSSAGQLSPVPPETVRRDRSSRPGSPKDEPDR